MFVRHLQVGDFRSWQHADLALGEGPTVLVGPNGQGKTNLIEAIGYVATLSSHRVATDGPLIRRGCSQAVIRAAVVNEGRELTVELELTNGKANRAKINRGPVSRSREVLGILRTVLFAPEDLSLVRGDPSGRRHFLDELLVSRTPRYAGIRSDYERVLRQRGALLKTAGGARKSGRRVELGTLEVWDGHLARYGAELLAGRLRLVAELARHVRAAYEGVAPRSAPADIAYRSSLGDALPADPCENPDPGVLEAALLTELERMREKELDRGVSLVGPHRDDLELLLGEAPAKGYASHGESWSLALALRLGAFELSRADGVEPVLILDDVFAELDRRRRARLAEVASTAQQVLVTAAVEEDVPEQLRGDRYDITDGEIHAR